MRDAQALTTTPMGLVLLAKLAGLDRWDFMDQIGEPVSGPGSGCARSVAGLGRQPGAGQSPPPGRGRGGGPDGRRGAAPSPSPPAAVTGRPYCPRSPRHVPGPLTSPRRRTCPPPRPACCRWPAPWLPRRQRSGGGTCPTLATSGGWAPVPGSYGAGRHWPRPSARKPRPMKKRNAGRHVPAMAPRAGQTYSAPGGHPHSRASFSPAPDRSARCRRSNRLRDRRRRGPLRDMGCRDQPAGTHLEHHRPGRLGAAHGPLPARRHRVTSATTGTTQPAGPHWPCPTGRGSPRLGRRPPRHHRIHHRHRVPDPAACRDRA